MQETGPKPSPFFVFIFCYGSYAHALLKTLPECAPPTSCRLGSKTALLTMLGIDQLKLERSIGLRRREKVFKKDSIGPTKPSGMGCLGRG